MRNFPDTNIAEKKKSGGTGNKKNHKSSGKPHTRCGTSLTQTLRRRRKAEEQEIKKLQIFRKTTYPSRNFPDTNIAAKTPYFFYFSAFSQAKASNSSKYPPAFSVFLHSFPRFIFPPHHPPFTHHSLIHCRHAHISSTLTAPPSSSPLTHASPIPLNTPYLLSRYSPLTSRTPCFSLRAAKPGLSFPSSFSFHASHTASFIRCPAYALFLRVNRSFFLSPR